MVQAEWNKRAEGSRDGWAAGGAWRCTYGTMRYIEMHAIVRIRKRGESKGKPVGSPRAGGAGRRACTYPPHPRRGRAVTFSRRAGRSLAR